MWIELFDRRQAYYTGTTMMHYYQHTDEQKVKCRKEILDFHAKNCSLYVLLVANTRNRVVFLGVLCMDKWDHDKHFSGISI